MTDRTDNPTAPRLTSAERDRLWSQILRYEGKPGVGFIGREARARIEEDDRQIVEEARALANPLRDRLARPVRVEWRVQGPLFPGSPLLGPVDEAELGHHHFLDSVEVRTQSRLADLIQHLVETGALYSITEVA